MQHNWKLPPHWVFLILWYPTIGAVLNRNCARCRLPRLRKRACLSWPCVSASAPWSRSKAKECRLKSFAFLSDIDINRSAGPPALLCFKEASFLDDQASSKARLRDGLALAKTTSQ